MTQQLLKGLLKYVRTHEENGSLLLGGFVVLIILFGLIYVFTPKLLGFAQTIPKLLSSPAPEPFEQTQNIPVTQPVRTYITTGTDTLWKIAEKYYKDGHQWMKIYEANKAIIPNPNVLEKNIELVIPE